MPGRPRLLQGCLQLFQGCPLPFLSPLLHQVTRSSETFSMSTHPSHALLQAVSSCRITPNPAPGRGSQRLLTSPGMAKAWPAAPPAPLAGTFSAAAQPLPVPSATSGAAASGASSSDAVGGAAQQLAGAAWHERAYWLLRPWRAPAQRTCLLATLKAATCNFVAALPGLLPAGRGDAACGRRPGTRRRHRRGGGGGKS